PRPGDLASTVPGVGLMPVNQVPLPTPGGQQALPMPSLPVPSGFPNPFGGGAPGMPMGGVPMPGMIPSYTPPGSPFAPGFRPTPGWSGPGAVPPGTTAPNTLIGGMLPPAARVPGVSPFGG